jgi:hypothetical protein
MVGMCEVRCREKYGQEQKIKIKMQWSTTKKWNMMNPIRH